jgi:hypothetical protein
MNYLYQQTHTKTILTFLLHFILTSPSSIFHMLYNKYYKYTITYNNTKLNNKNVIVFVHGRNGSPSDFQPLIDNIKRKYYFLNKNQLILNGFNNDDIVIKSTNNLLFVL